MGGFFKGKSGVSTTTSTTSAPAYLQPQLEFSTQEARRLYDQGLSPEEMQAARNLYDQSLGGLSETSRAAQNELQKTLRGDYLGITPELQNYMDVIRRRAEESYNESVLPSLRAGYGAQGAFGGSDFQQGLEKSGRGFTRSLSDAMTEVALRNYGQERAYQQGALNLAPTYEDLAYSPAIRQLQAAENLSNLPQKRLGLLNQNLQNAYIPGTNVTTSATPYKKSSGFQKALGVAGMIGGAIYGGPAGAAAGSQLGNLFGGGGEMNPTGQTSVGGMFGNYATQAMQPSWGSRISGLLSKFGSYGQPTQYDINGTPYRYTGGW